MNTQKTLSGLSAVLCAIAAAAPKAPAAGASLEITSATRSASGVEVSWRLSGASAQGAVPRLSASGADGATFTAKSFEATAADGGSAGRIRWRAAEDAPGGVLPERLWVALSLDIPAPYLALDLSEASSEAGSVEVVPLEAAPSAGWTDEHKSAQIVLRRVKAGSFDMGSPSDESGRDTDETLHSVTLSAPYYIGVFETTQSQWERLMGSNPAAAQGATRPVENVSWGAVRGGRWPVAPSVDSSSFVGRLRALSGRKGFDLPTEAQWEMAARAGASGAPSAAENAAAARFSGNPEGAADGPLPVGSLQPNAWGLFDMAGNVWELCRDLYQENLGSATATDPAGATIGLRRVRKGGGYSSDPAYCRPANRGNLKTALSLSPVVDAETGFRLCYEPDADGAADAVTLSDSAQVAWADDSGDGASGAPALRAFLRLPESVRPGEPSEGALFVTNAGPDALELPVFAIDAACGAVSFGGGEDATALWRTLPGTASPGVLAPGESASVPFVFSSPSPGAVTLRLRSVPSASEEAWAAADAAGNAAGTSETAAAARNVAEDDSAAEEVVVLRAGVKRLAEDEESGLVVRGAAASGDGDDGASLRLAPSGDGAQIPAGLATGDVVVLPSAPLSPWNVLSAEGGELVLSPAALPDAYETLRMDRVVDLAGGGSSLRIAIDLDTPDGTARATLRSLSLVVSGTLVVEAASDGARGVTLPPAKVSAFATWSQPPFTLWAGPKAAASATLRSRFDLSAAARFAVGFRFENGALERVCEFSPVETGTPALAISALDADCAVFAGLEAGACLGWSFGDLSLSALSLSVSPGLRADLAAHVSPDPADPDRAALAVRPVAKVVFTPLSASLFGLDLPAESLRWEWEGDALFERAWVAPVPLADRFAAPESLVQLVPLAVTETAPEPSVASESVVQTAAGPATEWPGAEAHVPHAWLAEKSISPSGATAADANAAAQRPTGKTDGAGRALRVVDDWIAGTDPADPDDRFTAAISIGPDGLPEVSPDPGPLDGREYTVEGKADLSGPWEPADAENHKFFRVKVSVAEEK